VAREDPEGRLLRGRAEENGRHEVEDGMARARGDDEHGQQEGDRVRVGRHGEGREDEGPGGLGRDDEGRDVVHVEPGGQARHEPCGEAEEDHREDEDEQPEAVHGPGTAGPRR